MLAYSSYLGGSDREEFFKGLAVDVEGYIYLAGGTHSTDYPVAAALQEEHASPGVDQDIVITKLTPDGQSIVYSTYLGGSDRDYAVDIDVDAAGNVYIVGKTDSADFPAVRPIQEGRGSTDSPDAFYAKLDASGEFLHFSSILGGSEYDILTGVAADTRGGMTFVGKTRSADLPTTRRAVQPEPGGATDAFVGRVVRDGSLRHLTYLGGAGYDYAEGVAIDARGHAVIVGPTSSRDFPVVAGVFQNELPSAGGPAQDSGFITHLHRSGRALLASTYYGGSGEDAIRGVAIGAAGSIYVVGDTNSSDLSVPGGRPPDDGHRDAFVALFEAQGSLTWATAFGGSGREFGHDVALGPAGEVYVIGQTRSPDLPVANATQVALAGLDDAFVAAFAADGSVRWATYLGGSGIDDGREIAASPSGSRLHIAGMTRSTDFPLIDPLLDPYSGVRRPRNTGDAFVASYDT